MKTVTILKGLPASGKTTWALAEIKKSNGMTKRINKDELRMMIDGGKYSKANEKLVLTIRDRMIAEYLLDGKSVIVDDTNLDPKHEARIREIAKDFPNTTVEIKTFYDVSVERCIVRDAVRAKPVGEHVIRKMYERYLKRSNQEITQTFAAVQNGFLPKAIICDLDGTLCHLNGRNPYNASLCINDLPNKPVLEIVKRFSGTHTIIFVSGREDTYSSQTQAWLRQHYKLPAILIMRKAKDNRKDSIVKAEIYNDHIRNKFFVEFVLDDRDQVVELWRQNGLTCLQVAPGSF